MWGAWSRKTTPTTAVLNRTRKPVEKISVGSLFQTRSYDMGDIEENLSLNLPAANIMSTIDNEIRRVIVGIN